MARFANYSQNTAYGLPYLVFTLSLVVKHMACFSNYSQNTAFGLPYLVFTLSLVGSFCSQFHEKQHTALLKNVFLQVSLVGSLYSLFP